MWILIMVKLYGNGVEIGELIVKRGAYIFYRLGGRYYYYKWRC